MGGPIAESSHAGPISDKTYKTFDARSSLAGPAAAQPKLYKIGATASAGHPGQPPYFLTFTRWVLDGPEQGCSGLLQKGLIAVAIAVRLS